MKKVSLIIAIMFMLSNLSFAEKGKPKRKVETKIAHNSSNRLVLRVDNAEDANIVVRIFENGLDFVHAEKVKAGKNAIFDISNLAHGNYHFKVYVNGDKLHTEIVNKQ